MRTTNHIRLNCRFDPDILRHLRRIEAKLDTIIFKENQIMASIGEALDDLEKVVTEVDGAEASAEAAFKRLADMIEALKQGQTDPATAARIQAAADAIRSKSAALAAAVTATPQG